MRLIRCTWSFFPVRPNVQIPVFLPVSETTRTVSIDRDEPDITDPEPFLNVLPSSDVRMAQWLFSQDIAPETCMLGLGLALSVPGWNHVECVVFGKKTTILENASGTLTVVLSKALRPRSALGCFFAFWDATTQLHTYLGLVDRSEASQMVARWIAKLPSLRDTP